MRSSLYLGISVFAMLSASAAIAGEDIFIYGGIGVVQLQSEFESETETANGLGLEGGASGAYQFSSTFGAQGDLVFKYGEFSSDSEYSLSDTSFDGALHAFYRDSNFLVGTFAQLGRTSLGFEDVIGFNFDRAYLGLEGQAYFDNVTLYGQIGASRLTLLEEQELGGWFGNAELRYFLTPDLKLEVHAGYATLAADEDEFELNTFNIGAGIEHALADLPFSIFAKADYFHTTGNGPMMGGESEGLGEIRALVGIKFNIGPDSLFDRDRGGATLKPVNPSLFPFTPVL